MPLSAVARGSGPVEKTVELAHVNEHNALHENTLPPASRWEQPRGSGPRPRGPGPRRGGERNASWLAAWGRAEGGGRRGRRGGRVSVRNGLGRLSSALFRASGTPDPQGAPVRPKAHFHARASRRRSHQAPHQPRRSHARTWTASPIERGLERLCQDDLGPTKAPAFVWHSRGLARRLAGGRRGHQTA